MHLAEPLHPGVLRVPHGELILPHHLIAGNDVRVPIQWYSWQSNGALSAQGTAGELRLEVDIKVGHGIHCDLGILNLGEEPVELREIAWQLELDQPQHIELLPHPGDSICTREPWDFNLTHETLSTNGSQSRYLRLAYKDSELFIGSDDPLKFGDGFLRCEPADVGCKRLSLHWHRIEPHWDYNGLFSTRPLNGLWIYEGQTRMATLSITLESQGLTSSPVPSPRVDPTLLPLCIASKAPYQERTRLYEKLELFRINQGEYSDLYAGGYDHRNHRQIEPHVCRAEYGEFLLHEYLRTGREEIWQLVTKYADRFQQTAVNRSNHAERGGAVRGRYGDNQTAHRIRSMRGAAFFWDMAELTGRNDYRRTAIGIANYISRAFPWNNARQGAAIRDLIYLWRETGDEKYLTCSQRILAVLLEAQHPSGAWWEYWNDNFDAYPYDPPGHHGGEWTPHATLKPEMASYNVNGILDALRLLGNKNEEFLPGAADMVHRAAKWLLQVQAPEGGWPFPAPDSQGLYGYGLYLDAAAMFKAASYFQEPEYFASGKRAVEFGWKLWRERGLIPAVTDVLDVELTECSLTYFFALEALAAQEACDA